MDYIGMTARTFKLRWKEHKYSWTHRNSKGPTELAMYIWDLDDRNKEWSIDWEIIGYGKPFEPGDRFCMLCNREKTEIVLSDRKTTLNNMNIIEKCRHMRGKMLGGMPEEKNKKSNDDQKSISEEIYLDERAKNVKVLLTPLKDYQLIKDCEVKLTPLKKEQLVDLEKYKENNSTSAEDTTTLFLGARRSKRIKNIRGRT